MDAEERWDAAPQFDGLAMLQVRQQQPPPPPPPPLLPLLLLLLLRPVYKLARMPVGLPCLRVVARPACTPLHLPSHLRDLPPRTARPPPGPPQLAYCNADRCVRPGVKGCLLLYMHTSIDRGDQLDSRLFQSLESVWCSGTPLPAVLAQLVRPALGDGVCCCRCLPACTPAGLVLLATSPALRRPACCPAHSCHRPARHRCGIPALRCLPLPTLVSSAASLPACAAAGHRGG